MEGLKKLERVQRTIDLLQSRNIITASNNNADSHRFLANFTLLLIKPCGELEIDMKCQLVAEHLPRISARFLEEAQVWIEGGDGIEHSENCAPLIGRADLKMSKSDESVAAIRLDDMQRANSTLDDFCRSYFMFHNMDPGQPRLIFKYLPILSFTESFIYRLDNLNEKSLRSSTTEDETMDIELNTLQDRRKWDIKSVETFGNDPFRPLVKLLENQGLMTKRIGEEFKCGEEYWALERKLCCALMKRMDAQISVEDVMRAIHLKSFDYRVLNLLMYQLGGQKVNELHMEFLSISEFLVEVSDDLFDYEDDVLENNFNILRMFVRIYGASAAPKMLAKFITEAEEEYERLLKALDPELSKKYKKRCEEATEEGGKVSGYSLGSWSIPSVIEDETSYRRDILDAESAVVRKSRN